MLALPTTYQHRTAQHTAHSTHRISHCKVEAQPLPSPRIEHPLLSRICLASTGEGGRGGWEEWDKGQAMVHLSDYAKPITSWTSKQGNTASLKTTTNPQSSLPKAKALTSHTLKTWRRCTTTNGTLSCVYGSARHHHNIGNQGKTRKISCRSRPNCQWSKAKWQSWMGREVTQTKTSCRYFQNVLNELVHRLTD